MLESVAEGALIDAGGRVTHDSETVGLVLSESTLEIRPIAVEDLSLALLHSVAVHSHEAIAIAMSHLRGTVHHSSIPGPLDPDLS